MSIFGLGFVRQQNTEEEVLAALPDAKLYPEEYQSLRRIEELFLQFHDNFAHPQKSEECRSLLKQLVVAYENELLPLRERRLGVITASPLPQLMIRAISQESVAAAAAPQVNSDSQLVVDPIESTPPALVTESSVGSTTNVSDIKLDEWDFDQRSLALRHLHDRVRLVRKNEQTVDGYKTFFKEERSLAQMADQINSLIHQINQVIVPLNLYKDLAEEEKPKFTTLIQKIKEIYAKIVYQIEFFQAIYYNDGKVFTETAFRYWKPSGNPELIAAKPFAELIPLKF